MSDSRPAPNLDPPRLSFEMKHRLGALAIDAAFEVTQPWTVLFGPSGSGKSTILRAVAGLIRPDSARIVLHSNQGKQIATDTSANIFIPAHRRAMRWTAQRPALFPHKTVRQNVSFGNQVGRLGTEQCDPVHATELVLEHFRLTQLGDLMPATLSGGEQHRVALARVASGAHGCFLLLDEPFTGLDAPLRAELVDDLRCWLAQSGTPVFSVTHDVGEAFLLNAEIIRLHEGRVLQQGPVNEVLAAERANLLAQLS